MDTPTAAAPESAGAALPPPIKSPFTVVQQPVLEGGIYYLKNQTVLLTAERAKSLGDQVTVKTVAVPPPKPDPVAKVAAAPPAAGKVEAKK